MAGPRRKPTFEQFFAVRRFQPTLTFTPDSRKILFATNISGQFNLWRIGVRGGWPEQLTTFEDQTVRTVTVSPDGKTIVFTADQQGDEFHQLYALPARGGWPEAWTQAPGVQHFTHQQCWSPDGARLAFAANARVPSDMEVWVRDVGSGEVRRVFGEGKYALPVSWTRDGDGLLVFDARSAATDNGLYLVDARSGEAVELLPHDQEIRYYPGPWDADGTGFYLLTDEGRDFLGLAYYRLNGRAVEWVDTPQWDVEQVSGSHDGRYLAWIVNEGGWGRVRIRDLHTGAMLPEPQLPPGSGSILGIPMTFSRDGRYAVLIWSQPRVPGELYVVEVATGKARRLTDSMVGGLRERDLAQPELVHIPTFDGKEIPAWLYRPPVRKGAKVPVVLAIHGGPQAQERPWYASLYQYLVSRGMAVLAPNIRGSTGYGKAYQQLINRDWGGGDLRDFEHAATWLQAQPWVDPARMGVFGGSYGGFATLSLVTRLPQYWAAAAELVGPSNLVTFAKAVPPSWRRWMTSLLGDPESEADFLRQRSPITYVDNVRAPLLIIQGANDPRVVKPESDQMVERLRSLGREVEYVVFEDEGHGFTKRANELRAFRLAAEWLERHLLDGNRRT